MFTGVTDAKAEMHTLATSSEELITGKTHDGISGAAV